jgi:Transposase DDE domain
MSSLTKSPRYVARRALAAGRSALRCYAHKYSPKKYTQPQLFACLVLKVFFKTDYRGIVIFLEDLPDLAGVLGLRQVPHWTTLQKASRRLLVRRRVRRLLAFTVGRLLGPRRRRVRRAALDSSGFECGHTSHYYARRRTKGASGQEKVRYRRYAKLEAAFDCQTHLILGAIPRRGPAVDTDRFVPLLDEALVQVRIQTALADAGYDSEANHRHARERRGVKSFIPAEAGRPSAKPPVGRYRRQMKQRLDKDYGSYGQRWQAETGFSMIKRRLGSALGGRSYQSRCRELLLWVLTYNLMLEY